MFTLLQQFQQMFKMRICTLYKYIFNFLRQKHTKNFRISYGDTVTITRTSEYLRLQIQTEYIIRSVSKI